MTHSTKDESFIPVEHLAEIGRVTNAWAHFEFAVDQTTWEVCEIPHQIGACLTSQIHSARDKMNALIHVCDLRQFPSSLINELKEFNSKIASQLQSKRNRIVHDTRMVKADTNSIERLQITARKKLNFGFIPEPLEEVQAIRKEIEDMIRTFSDLSRRIVSEVDGLPTVDLMQINIQRPASSAE